MPYRLNAKEHEAVRKALEEIDSLPDGKSRRIVIDGALIDGYYSLEGAAMLAYVSYETARRYQKDMILRVARYLDLIDRY